MEWALSVFVGFRTVVRKIVPTPNASESIEVKVEFKNIVIDVIKIDTIYVILVTNLIVI